MNRPTNSAGVDRADDIDGMDGMDGMDGVDDVNTPTDTSVSGDPAVGSRRPIAAIVAGVVGVVLAALIVLLMVSNGDERESAMTPLLNNVAPTARGEYADGTPFDLSRRKGSWVVLNFFTPDCIPCIAEHPELERFVAQQASLGLEGAEFYSVVQHASVEEVEEFFATHGGDWPVVYDTKFEFQTGFGVAQVPETWVIDPNGIVVARQIGQLPSADALSAEIQRMRETLAGGG